MKFLENLAILKSALVSLLTAQATYVGVAKDDGYDSVTNNLKWLVSDLKRLIKDEWVTQQVFKDGISQESLDFSEFTTEAGATLSKATKAAIGDVVAALVDLVTPEEGADEAEDLAQFNTGVKSALEETVVGLETIIEDAHLKTKKAKKKKIVPGESTHEHQGIVGETVITTLSTILSEGSDPANDRYRMIVIREGLSGNKVNYSGEVLAESAEKLNGRPMYLNHPEGIEIGQPKPRGIQNKIGWWSESAFVTDLQIAKEDGTVESVNAIVATANLLGKDNSPQPWFPGMVREALEKGRPDLVGISIVAGGSFEIRKGKAKGEVYKEALRIDNYLSADAVAEPGAGGQPISIAANKGVDQEVMDWEKLTAEAVAEMSLEQCVEGLTLRTDLKEAFEARLKALSAEGATSSEEKPNPAPTSEGAPSTPTPPTPPTTPEPTLVEQQQTAIEALQRQVTQGHLTSALNQIDNEAVRTNITAEVGEQILTDEQVDVIVKRFTDLQQAITTEVQLPGQQGFLTAGVVIPSNVSATDNQTSKVDQVMESLADFFKDKKSVPEDRVGKVAKIRSFREFYVSITGDTRFEGRYQPSGALADVWETTTFSEALPGAANVVGGGTITMSGLLGTSMNRALFNFYQAQPKWWKPVVTPTDLADMKQQDRIRLHNFGSLTERTVDGAEYTELAWNETAESYTPTEYGNLVPVGRRAIINDDLRGIQNIPKLLAQSAILTLNEYVSNLFTQNSGSGPTLSDGVQVFNAASHQGNKVSTSLSRKNLIDLRKVTMKMNNDAGKRLGLMPRYLLVPVDLEDTAFELIKSEKVPGSANNEPNILADPEEGMRARIVVPNWTDVNNWYIMADPEALTSIEMGFLFGKEEPDLLQQDAPTAGMVWTNDVISFKVRQDFGGDWLDYRGAAAAIVA